jgi:hypothetical protein
VLFVRQLRLICGLAVATLLQAQTPTNLSSPTFYIAASGEYNKFGTTLPVKGVSNLPAGSRLVVRLYDYVGYQSTVLSEDAQVVLDKGGFFEVTLKPREGKRFKDNMVCEILFSTNFIQQDAAVLKIVGKKGELLGIENNPQVKKQSGDNYYLEALVHIP